MAFTVTRSTAEILRLTRQQWENTEIYAFLVDASGASPTPTAASSTATWLTYALIDPISSSYAPSWSPASGDFSYSTPNTRAQSGLEVFSFDDQIAFEFGSFSSTTVTHVIFADVYGFYIPTSAPPFAVLEEASPLTLTGSSTLSYSVRVFGKAA